METDQARRMAVEAELDLVEVAPTAKPPVCRIMDYGKWKYKQKKKDSAGEIQSAQDRSQRNPHAPPRPIRMTR